MFFLVCLMNDDIMLLTQFCTVHTGIHRIDITAATLATSDSCNQQCFFSMFDFSAKIDESNATKHYKHSANEVQSHLQALLLCDVTSSLNQMPFSLKIVVYWELSPGFFRCFMDPIWVPKIRENYHRVPGIKRKSGP